MLGIIGGGTGGAVGVNADGADAGVAEGSTGGGPLSFPLPKIHIPII